jgi:hypothetical protein
MGCEDCNKKNKKIMVENKGELTKNEILFCERWSQVIKRKDRVVSTDLDYCHNLVFGSPLTSQCSGCLRDYASKLHNYWKTISSSYEDYLLKKSEYSRWLETDLGKLETGQEITIVTEHEVEVFDENGNLERKEIPQKKNKKVWTK